MLLQLSQIAPYKAITSNINSTKDLEPFIQEAQEFDLRNFLGEQLYIDLLDDFEASPSLAKYSDLYNGSTYTISDIKRKHEGLVPILAYFTYARYVAATGVVSTKFGLVQKTNDWSQPISEASKARLIQQAKSGAIVYQERVKLFLDLNWEDFPLWRFGYNRKRGGIRLTSVGGNSKDKRFSNCIKCGNGYGLCNCNYYDY